MNCPGCSSPLTQVKYESEVIDRCQQCGGAWLDQGEISKIIENVEENFSEQEKISAFETRGEPGNVFRPGHLKCPKCQAALSTVQYAYNSGVFIDCCPNKHGIWMDRGELVKVQVVREQSQADHAQQTGKQAKLPPIPSASKRLCPRDGSSLKEFQYESERIDVCTKCGGVWCDQGELKAIIDDRSKVFQSADFQEIRASESHTKVVKREAIVASLPCAVCRQTMERLNFDYSSGIIIDRCRQGHGVWLDLHELDRIQVWAERWQQEQPALAQKYAQSLDRAAKQAAASWDKSMAEAGSKAQNMSMIGRFLKKAGF